MVGYIVIQWEGQGLEFHHPNIIEQEQKTLSVD